VDHRTDAPVAWSQLKGAHGSAAEAGELLSLMEEGEDVWGVLIDEVLHPSNLYEATAPAIAWVIQRLEQGRLANRRAWAFMFLSTAAASAVGLDRNGRFAAGVLASLGPAEAPYEKGLADTEVGVRVASVAIWKAVAGDRHIYASGLALRRMWAMLPHSWLEVEDAQAYQ